MSLVSLHCSCCLVAVAELDSLDVNIGQVSPFFLYFAKNLSVNDNRRLLLHDNESERDVSWDVSLLQTRLLDDDHMLCVHHKLTREQVQGTLRVIGRLIARQTRIKGLSTELTQCRVDRFIGLASLGCQNGFTILSLAISPKSGKIPASVSPAVAYVIRSLILVLIDLPLPLFVLGDVVSIVFGPEVEEALLNCDSAGKHMSPSLLRKYRAGGRRTGLVPLIINVDRLAQKVRAARKRAATKPKRPKCVALDR